MAVDEDSEKARELWKKYGVGIVAGVVLDAWLRPTKAKRKKQKTGGKED